MSIGQLPAGSMNRVFQRGAVTTQQTTYRFGGGGVEGVVTHRAEWRGDLLAPALLQAAITSLRKAIKLAIEIAKRLVPVDTGRLHDSIRSGGIRADGSRLVGTVHAGGVVRHGIMVDYAVWQEIGTRFNRAHFYMLRAGQEAAPFFWAFMLARGGGFGANQIGGVSV